MLQLAGNSLNASLIGSASLINSKDCRHATQSALCVFTKYSALRKEEKRRRGEEEKRTGTGGVSPFVC